MRLLVLAAALLPSLAAAQVDVGDGAGDRLHVGANGATTLRSGGAATVSVHGHPGRGCAGSPVSVSGSGLRYTVSGICGSVSVSGSGNVVHVRVAPGATISVSGSGNQVIWTPADPRGGAPRIEQSGTRNSVRRG